MDPKLNYTSSISKYYFGLFPMAFMRALHMLEMFPLMSIGSRGILMPMHEDSVTDVKRSKVVNPKEKLFFVVDCESCNNYDHSITVFPYTSLAKINKLHP